MPADSALAHTVCARFSLPAPQSVTPVSGGLQHRLLRLDFEERESLALKILSPRALATPADVLRFEHGETLASLAAQNGVPAMVALKQPDGSFIGQIGGNHFLLFPWVEGNILPPHAVSPARAHIMGGYLARVHSLAVRFPEQSAPVPEAFPDGHFLEISRRACEQNTDWAPRLSDAKEELERLNSLARAAQSALQDGWVTGHLDYDQKNVLWNGNEPLILDWEQAKPIHPALEAMGAGLSWAGQSAGAPSKETFLAWLAGYRAQNELTLADLERAVDGVIGKWTIWLEFNLQRLFDTELAPHEHQIAFDCGMHALGTTLQLGADGPMYRAWCRKAVQS